MTRQRVTAFVIELAMVTTAMVIYFLIRGGLPQPVPEAVARSTKIIHLEQALGIFVEREWQEPVLDNRVLMQIANGIYVWGHFPVIIAAAFWLYWKNRKRYGLYRTGLVLSGFLGLWGYAFFPAAPPRLMPREWGFVDTIALIAKENYDMQPAPFLNHYAAVPSLHFGWAMLAGIAIWQNSRNPALRAFAILMPAAMFWSIVVTANHFIFDMLVGAAIVLVALFISWLYYSGRLPVRRVLARAAAAFLKSPGRCGLIDIGERPLSRMAKERSNSERERNVETVWSFPPPRRFARYLAEHRVFRDFFELTLVGIAFLLYFLVRGSAVDRTGEAFNRAVRIIDLEQKWGFFWELELQTLIMGSRALVQLFNAIYFWLDFPLIVVVGLWLYFWHRHQYTITRDAILTSGAIALVIYHLFPVAPPRLLSGFGFVDTLAVFSNLSYQAQSTQPFVNPYAAVPSLHVGWAFLLMLGIMGATRSKPIWLLAALLPVAQFAAIVVTANHFIFDAIIGLVVSLMGLVIAIMLQRFGYAYLRRWLGQEPAVKARAANV